MSLPALETVTNTQTEYGLELYALFEVAVLVSNEYTRVILHAGGQGDIEHLEELIADSDVPIDIEVTELAVVVGVLEILVSISLCVPCACTVGCVVECLEVETFALVGCEQSECGAQSEVLVLVSDSALERQTELSAEVAVDLVA